MFSLLRISPGTARARKSSLKNVWPAPADARPTLKRSGLILGWACGWLLLGAPAAFGASVGDPLSQALDELERSGLTLIYSSVLVTPELRVLEDPGRGASEDIARRLLAPHRLTLKPIRAGTFAIVRADPAADPLTLTDA